MARDKGNKVFRAVMKGLRDRTPTDAERRADEASAKRIETERKRLAAIAERDRKAEVARQQAEAAHAAAEAERRNRPNPT